MLDQKRTGQFITDLRKEKGLTQRQLAEEIGVSDKAISRWETGRGMPDTSIMPDLCLALGINVNELLSGERLSQEAYSGKAENNMVELMKDSENLKRENRRSAIGNIVGMLILLLFTLCIVILSGGSKGVLRLLDLPSLLVVLGIQWIALAVSGQFPDFFRSFRLVFGGSHGIGENAEELTRRSEYALSFGIKVLLLGSLLFSMLSLLFMLGSLTDPAQIGPRVAASLLTLVYGSFLALILLVMKGKLHGSLPKRG